MARQTPEDYALDCFLRTQMDVLVMGQTLVEKNKGGDAS